MTLHQPATNEVRLPAKAYRRAQLETGLDSGPALYDSFHIQILYSFAGYPPNFMEELPSLRLVFTLVQRRMMVRMFDTPG